MKALTTVWPSVRVAAGACLLLLVAACGDEPAAPEIVGQDLEGPAAPAFSALLTCRVDVAAGSMSCDQTEGPFGQAGGPQGNLIVGSQHRFVRMSNTSINWTESIWYTGVSVQNLTLQPFGTEDGTTAEATGVRVFFVDEPSNGVEVLNHDGEAEFTGSGTQKYYEYSGADLGADGILSPGETSASKSWWFAHNGAMTFEFSVLISTTVPDPDNYAVHLTQISAGYEHVCGVSSDGRAWCWGRNDGGQLGNATDADRFAPTPVDMPPGVTFSRVSVGEKTSCADGSDGNVWCWGKRALGNPSVAESATPVKVTAPLHVKLSDVVVGGNHACARGDDGEAYCWGANGAGQLGNGTWTNSDGATLVKAPSNVAFTRLAAGLGHTCADGDDGNVWCWGNNLFGTIGDSTFLTRSVPTRVKAPTGVALSQVIAGDQHSCAQGDDDDLYCWGSNADGQLGFGAPFESVNAPTPVESPSDVVLTRVTGGRHHTCAIGSDESAYCWGANSSGRLGNGTQIDAPTPVAVDVPPGVTFRTIHAGAFHTCAMSSADEPYCWGHNLRLQLGIGSEVINAIRPVRVVSTRAR